MRWIQHRRAKSVPKVAWYVMPYELLTLHLPSDAAVHTHGDVSVGFPNEGWFSASGSGRVWLAPSDVSDQETHLMRWQED